MYRILVSPSCSTPCPSCAACRPDGREASLEQVLARGDLSDVLLGGGDVTRWKPLAALLDANRRREAPQRIWIEAPAASLTRPVLAALATRGLFGVLVQIEAMGEAMARVMRVGDGERAVADAEACGLEVQARVCVRPKTFAIVAPLARKLAPRPVWLEIVRQDWGGEPQAIPDETLSSLLLACPNVAFSGHRSSERGYLPPCALPHLWQERPAAWRTTFRARDEGNAALPDCEGCGVRQHCQWNDPGALSAEAREKLRPPRSRELPWDRKKSTQSPVPTATAKKRSGKPVLCVTPWTTMEVVDPDGRVRQCCSTWTVGDRGNAKEAPLASVWNGPGYQLARRQMARQDLDALCQPICSRLHDQKFAETEFTIQSGSEPFVRNQLLLAEEIAERREIVRGKPLRLALCPSTYCNYNCIMCNHGRSPRRELPESIWEELPELMPTLQSLTLLGGEPLANPLTMRFLRDFDVARWPDAAVDLVTNGSLLTENTLKHLTRCTLGDVTVSMNAGTPEVYERVQRGVSFDKLLKNLDALLAFRDVHHRWFGITVSFVLQPAAAHTVLDFARIAYERNLRIRLMALNPENHEGLDFYLDDDAVARVVEHADQLVAFCERLRPDWVREARAGRSAVLEEAASRKAMAKLEQAAKPPAGARRLPVIP